MVVDPSLEEEAAAAGSMTVIMNAFGELCAVQKTTGMALTTAEVNGPLASVRRRAYSDSYCMVVLTSVHAMGAGQSVTCPHKVGDG